MFPHNKIKRFQNHTMLITVAFCDFFVRSVSHPCPTFCVAWCQLAKHSVNLRNAAHVRIHVGSPLDFSNEIHDFNQAHPHLTPFSDPDAFSAADCMGPEKRVFYRYLTDQIRESVVECHSEALRRALEAAEGERR
jgi:hypothetical protein